MSTDELYIMVGDVSEGPYSLDDLFAMWHSKRITFATVYAQNGDSDWRPLSDFQAVFMQRLKQTAQAATPAAPKQAPQVASTSAQITPLMPPRYPVKSRGVYIILAILFGPLGFHNFYGAFYKSGAFQFILSILLWWTLIVPIVLWFVAILEAISQDEDGHGQMMA